MGSAASRVVRLSTVPTSPTHGQRSPAPSAIPRRECQLRPRTRDGSLLGMGSDVRHSFRPRRRKRRAALTVVLARLEQPEGPISRLESARVLGQASGNLLFHLNVL